MNITRRDVIGRTLAAVAVQDARAAAEPDEGQRFFLRLLQANDEAVARILGQAAGAASPRLGRGSELAALVAAYCSPESSFHRSERLIPRLERAAQGFLSALDADGLLDAGNLSSPPDTGFVVEATAAALEVARRSRDQRLARLEETLRQFLLRVGGALVTGGIHTPNHRWVVCAALARIHSLFPDARYVDRIDDWLGEGIYQDADGQFPERSPNYARVEVNAFLTMARLLNRPAQFEPVRRHLVANLYLMQPDGELETIHSRRQDQDRPVHAVNFYLQYRYMAIHDSNPAFAAVARMIAERPGEGLVEGANPVLHFLEEPLLRRPLPEGGAIPSDYRHVFANSQLVRIRRGERAASVFGGDDQPQGIASGLAHNPTFFNFRKGKAILDSVRMGGRFFSLGVFRAQGIAMEGDRIALHQRLEAPYYQPLPKEYRRADGDYALTPVRDGRFWSKLDFPHRRVSNVQVLEQKVTVVEKQDAFELHIEVTGHDRVPYAVELAFRPGGQFGGGAGQSPFLKEGMGTYRVGSDGIEFGPGQADHEVINLSGHTYQAHGAALRAAGNCIYITGYTPFRKVITIRGV
ncbi:hypothetical protein [Paludibaculum fermentans]|uniref:hypothetical protein n=1 Tax=Paludibaculum fermentans TaxID=1473598 RepID=UPI003EC02612